MASQEKQKKGFLHFYKFSTKTQKPRSQTAVVTTNNKIKPAVTQSHSSLQKKLENCEEIEPVVTANEPAAVMLQSSLSLLLKKLENSEDVEHGGRRGNFVEARKSVSHVETNLASAISFLQVKVLVSDMPGSMQVHAFRCARRTYDSLEKFSS